MLTGFPKLVSRPPIAGERSLHDVARYRIENKPVSVCVWIRSLNLFETRGCLSGGIVVSFVFLSLRPNTHKNEDKSWSFIQVACPTRV